MNLGSPPTDNLYKFLAIFGLILILFSFWLPLQGVDRMLTKLEVLSPEAEMVKTSSKMLGAERKALLTRLDSLESRVDSLLKAVSDKPQSRGANDPLLSNLLSDKRALESKMSALEKKEQDLHTREAALSGNAISINALSTLLGLYRLYGNICAAIGAFMTVMGFFLWYVQLQRHQDAVLQLDVQQRIAELETKPGRARSNLKSPPRR